MCFERRFGTDLSYPDATKVFALGGPLLFEQTKVPTTARKFCGGVGRSQSGRATIKPLVSEAVR